MRKILFVLLVTGLVLGGCGLKLGQNQTNETGQVQDGAVLRLSGKNLVELSVDSENKVSAADLKIEAQGAVRINGFVSNQQAFNAELMNKGTETNWEVSLGAMLATKDLPSGKIVLGNIKYSGDGKLAVRGLKLIGPGSDGGNPVEVLLKDVEIEVKE